MTIKIPGKNHRKLNVLEEIKIMRAAKSGEVLNDAISGKIELIYKLLPQVHSWNLKS